MKPLRLWLLPTLDHRWPVRQTAVTALSMDRLLAAAETTPHRLVGQPFGIELTKQCQSLLGPL